ncbi:hypothetical protein AA0120_g9466 [Alternaria tenuissima]|nr:hypothetical protein AA0120_g9466 [Alternaria tenuissima]RYO49124.1 hypothetical protein AA0116_g12304 [Alternaria tenuissima]
MPIASPPAMVPNHESPTPRIETQLPPPTMDVGLDRKVYAHLPRTEQLALRPKAVLLWLRDMDVTIESAQREGLIPDISMSPEVMAEMIAKTYAEHKQDTDEDMVSLDLQSRCEIYASWFTPSHRKDNP